MVMVRINNNSKGTLQWQGYRIRAHCKGTYHGYMIRIHDKSI